ncbi:hypothetical protein PR048_009421 [Dryococelus australis]|uniref:GH18 domain-containing protein n=1 Tax=Dryococelus australis TaxID=614101 RepID=A0ABQ9HZU4_9NEOP|nr:hypothetical protein PR048_009421 [Dryococelus australis]
MTGPWRRPRSNIVASLPRAGGYAKFTGLKTYNKELKTMLAIGGWNEGSARFSSLVADEERRTEFVKNVVRFLRQNRFDGLDLDWEYPAFRDGGKPRDRDNYALLVQVIIMVLYLRLWQVYTIPKEELQFIVKSDLPSLSTFLTRLECVLDVIFLKRVKPLLRFALDVRSGVIPITFGLGPHLREESRACRSQIRRARWSGAVFHRQLPYFNLKTWQQTEKGEAGPHFDQVHARRLSGHLWHCASRINPPGPDRQWRVLLPGLKSSEGVQSARASGFVIHPVTEVSSHVSFWPKRRAPARMAESAPQEFEKKDVQDRFEKWQERWDHYIDMKRNYLEAVPARWPFVPSAYARELTLTVQQRVQNILIIGTHPTNIVRKERFAFGHVVVCLTCICKVVGSIPAGCTEELREEFDREHSKTRRPRLLLTMAVPAGIEYIDKGYDVPKLNSQRDRATSYLVYGWDTEIKKLTEWWRKLTTARSTLRSAQSPSHRKRSYAQGTSKSSPSTTNTTSSPNRSYS